uniref:MADF domain-containing protein n=1 Tax=Parascaris univalens TaxID=6257 RepID=A0A915AD45_PARUN
MEIPLNKNGEADNHLLAHPDARHEAAKINDELRFSIIDAVYLRPAIWDHGREPKSLGQRKDYFIEIAALLSTEDNILSCYDIEKQWKNLKDTYLKTRKKVVTDESGCIVPPRWKFFSAMTFLDQLGVPQTSSSASSSQHSHTLLGKRTCDRKPMERRLSDTRAVPCGVD